MCHVVADEFWWALQEKIRTPFLFQESGTLGTGVTNRKQRNREGNITQTGAVLLHDVLRKRRTREALGLNRF